MAIKSQGKDEIAIFFHCLTDVLNNIESYHDAHTMQHEKRVAKLMSILGQAIGLQPKACIELEQVGCLHDIGKLAVSAKILEKPSRLSKMEKKIIELHPQIGYELMNRVQHPLGELAALVCISHHETFDGSGYPHGLKGQNIPLVGRLCMVCDVYDALRTRRHYTSTIKNHSHQSVQAIMYDKTPTGMWHKFDPTLLDAFMSISEEYLSFYEHVELAL